MRIVLVSVDFKKSWHAVGDDGSQKRETKTFFSPFYVSASFTTANYNVDHEMEY